ncbi:hypothetical protein RQP46_002681 [Phenoliferia psychrophenolica]
MSTSAPSPTPEHQNLSRPSAGTRAKSFIIQALPVGLGDAEKGAVQDTALAAPVARRERAVWKFDLLATFGEFVGTFLFLYMSFTSAQSAVYSSKQDLNDPTSGTKDNQTILFIVRFTFVRTQQSADVYAQKSLSFGMSLLVCCWVFFRITGAAFNPAVSFSLWLIGGVSTRRFAMIVPAQLLGGICAAGLAKVLTLGAFGVETTLSPGVSNAQGLFIEMFTTALLTFTVLMTAAEKSKSIGLSLFIGHLGSVGWTGAGINPARSLGPSVANASFPTNAWIYYIGQGLGSLLATGIYVIFKHFDYKEIVAGMDSGDHLDSSDISAGPMVKAFTRGRAGTLRSMDHKSETSV